MRFSRPALVVVFSAFAVSLVLLGHAPHVLAACPSGQTCLDNPLGVTNINVAIGQAINIILGLSGAVALLMFVWGGVQWLISGGNADRVKAGKSTLTWAALGIVVIFLSYTLVNALVNALSNVSP